MKVIPIGKLAANRNRDSGDTARTSETLPSPRIVKSLRPEQVREAARRCRAAGDPVRTLELYRTLSRMVPDDPEAKEQIKELQRELGSGPDLDGTTMEPLSKDILETLMRRFAGREDVHAVQYADSNRDRMGYRPVWRAPNRLDWMAHLEGDLTLGVYPVRSDGTVSFAAVDIDVKKEFLPQRRLDPAFAATVEESMRGGLRKLIARCNDRNLPAMAEWSGKKGYHLWLFFETPVAARAVRLLLKQLIQGLGAEEMWSLELFPKQDRVPEGGIGNLIKLPLGIHLGTGKRSTFLEAGTLEPQCALEALRTMRTIPASCLPATTSAPVPTAEREPTRADRSSTCRSSGSFLGRRRRRGGRWRGPRRDDLWSPESAPDGKAAVRAVFENCPVLRSLLKKATREGHLTHGERVVLLYTLGHLGPVGFQALHKIISHCSDYDPDVTARHCEGMWPSPIGCTGIARWLPETVERHCTECQFAIPENGYPTPLLHATSPRGSGETSASRKLREPGD